VASLDAWARQRLDAAGSGSPAHTIARARLRALRFLVDDGRLRERAMLHVESGATAVAAVERVAREYARVLGSAADETLRERAIEMEALLALLHQRLAAVPAALPVPGRVHAAGRLAVFEAVD